MNSIGHSTIRASCSASPGVTPLYFLRGTKDAGARHRDLKQHMVFFSKAGTRLIQAYAAGVQRLSFVCSTSEVGCPYPLWNVQNLGAVPP